MDAHFYGLQDGGLSEIISLSYKYFQMNSLIIQLHLMFAVKVSYKGKIILLGKGIQSFEKIKTELSTRFPGQVQHGITVKYQGSILTDFDDVVRIVDATNSKTIKLQIEAMEQPMATEEIKPVMEKKEVDQIDNSFISGSSSHKEDVKPALQLKVEEGGNVPVHQSNEIFIEESSISMTTEQKLRKKSVSVRNDRSIKLEQSFNSSCDIGRQQGKQNINKSSSLSNYSQEKDNSKKSCVSQKKSVLSKRQKSLKGSFCLSKKSEKASSSVCNVSHKQKSEKASSSVCNESEKQKSEKASSSVCNESEKQKPEKKYGDSFIIEDSVSSIKKEEDAKKVEVDESKSSINMDPYISEMNHDDIYKCFYCEGTGLCKVCKSTGRLTENSKFMKLIDAIIDKKLEKKLRAIQEGIQKSLMMGGKIKKEESEIKKEKVDELGLQIDLQQVSEIKKVKIEESLFSSKIIDEKVQGQVDYKKINFQMRDYHANPKKLLVGEQFAWTFVIKNQIRKDNKEINIIDEKTGATMQINFINGGQVRVGPFKCEQEGKFQRVFRLFYFDKNSDMQYFGPKFGFSVMVDKDIKARQLVNNFRIKIETIKKGYKIARDTEYLVEKLKEININEENYIDNQDLLPDILQSL